MQVLRGTFIDGGTTGQHSFFDAENRLRNISKLDDPLERLTAAIPREIFRPLGKPVHE